jgi:hypothetical protein
MKFTQIELGIKRAISGFNSTVQGREPDFVGRYEVAFKEMTRDPKSTMRQVLGHCGLAIEEACLRPELNTSPVATPSSAQVRESIHTRSIAPWRHYEKQLEPLRQALVAAGLPSTTTV